MARGAVSGGRRSKRILTGRGAGCANRYPVVDCGGRAARLRRESMAKFTARDLVEKGSLPPRALDACAERIRQHHKVLVTGVLGAGKTTPLQAMAGLPPLTRPCSFSMPPASWAWTGRAERGSL